MRGILILSGINERVVVIGRGSHFGFHVFFYNSSNPRRDPCNQSDSYMYDMMLIDTLISPLFQIASEVLQFLFGITKLLLLWAAILDFRLPRSQTTMKQGSWLKHSSFHHTVLI